jgi:hypothetical protein
LAVEGRIGESAAMKNLLTRRRALQAGLAALATPAILNTKAWAAEPPVLVELFTSQGCSDCPPADRLMGELKSRPDLHVVSLNVDYWDYLGWKDTLGKAEYSQRQQDYARARGDSEVYTPQAVINGERHAVGSNRSQIEAAIAAVRAGAVNVPILVKEAGGNIEVSVGALAGESGTLWLMGVAPEVSVAIGRGENKGTAVTYHNVARQVAAAGTWDGTSRSFSLSRSAVAAGDCRTCLAVLEHGHVGRVLGIGALTLS